ncbi:hypothetical protein ND2E_2863 [Colwellia psychrerythraea]|uniref:Uncharacterized protein n=1 Tax=Colwellia psychrerythraea TaxID=28229 RepID=A0A099KR14_COLPS|nr:hypothetical protein ND2E_2863 [Colwellia psychrerythraea]
MLFVASFFKEITLNKKRRLDHESLKHTEILIFKWFGYIDIETTSWLIVSVHTQTSIYTRLTYVPVHLFDHEIELFVH